jgi:hypothetical protein
MKIKKLLLNANVKLRFPTLCFLTRCGTARHGKNCRTHKKEEVFPNVRRGAARHGDGTVRRGFLNRFWSDFFQNCRAANDVLRHSLGKKEGS